MDKISDERTVSLVGGYDTLHGMYTIKITAELLSDLAGRKIEIISISGPICDSAGGMCAEIKFREITEKEIE